MSRRCDNCGAPLRKPVTPCEYCGVVDEACVASSGAAPSNHEERNDIAIERDLLDQIRCANEARIAHLRRRALAAIRNARDGMEKLP